MKAERKSVASPRKVIMNDSRQYPPSRLAEIHFARKLKTVIQSRSANGRHRSCQYGPLHVLPYYAYENPITRSRGYCL